MGRRGGEKVRITARGPSDVACLVLDLIHTFMCVAVIFPTCVKSFAGSWPFVDVAHPVGLAFVAAKQGRGQRTVVEGMGGEARWRVFSSLACIVLSML